MQVPKLTPAEEKLIKAAAEGSVADYRVGQDNDPAQGGQWGEDRTLRAEILSELASGSTWPVHRKGIRARGARITGGFDLEFAQVDRPLRIESSHFEKQLTLTGASVSELLLSGSYLAGGIDGDGLSVKGSVCLDQGFHATGEVRFLGAEIGGVFSCTGGRLENPDADALTADRFKVKGSVFLNEGFHATGAVMFPGAEIGGQLNCTGGRFENPGADALAADGLRVKGDVFLDEVHVTGEVRFLGAEIGGAFVCTGGQFENPSGNALNIVNADIRREFLFRNLDQRPTGLVDLSHAKVGQLCDDQTSWPERGSLVLEGFVYEMLALDAPRAAEERLCWLGLQREFRTQPYEQLATVLRRMGEDRKAIRVLVQKNWEIGRRERAGNRGWLANRFLWITTRYGYNPAYALLWLLGVVVLGYFEAHFAYRLGMLMPSGLPAAGVLAQLKLPASECPKFHASLYAVDALLPLDLGQQSQWQIRHTDGREYIVLQFVRLLYLLAAFCSRSSRALVLPGSSK